MPELQRNLSTMPVSYTHLDVYKRQALDGYIVFLSVRGTFNHHTAYVKFVK